MKFRNTEIFELPDFRCPECGEEPTLYTALYGKVYYAQCSKCFWEGETRDMEMSPQLALEHWHEKAKARKQKREAML